MASVSFLGSNIKLNSTEPNFVRDVIKTYAELVSTTANHENNYDVGHIVYCEETKSHYVFLGAGYHGAEEFEGDAWRRMDHMLAFSGIENLVDHVQFPSNSDVAPIAGKFMLLNDNCLFYGMEDNTPQLISANLDSEEDFQLLVDAGVALLTGGVVTIGGTDLYYVNHDEVLVRIANNDDIESLSNTIASKQDKLSSSTKLFTLNGTSVYFGGSATIETGGGDSSGSDCSCNFVVVEGSDEFEDFGDWSAAVVAGEELETSGTVANEELELTSGLVSTEELIM